MKRIISIFLASVMIISAVLCVDLSALATDVEVSNRAEWLSKLTQVYDMTVEEDNYPDNYFSDLDDESPYYRDIMVAAEFGLIDVEAGEAVNPEGDITREFAAQTLNFCAGWELEKDDDFTYSFADYESCAYPDDDQIAVDHNWIALDNGNFLPDQKVTAAEINTMLADAQETLKGDEVDENYESTFEYNDGVVEVPANTAVDFNDNEVVIHSTNYNIKENSTFVVYSNGIPVVYTAVKVTNNGDSLTVKTSEDVDGEVVEDIDMQEAFDVNASDLIPAEGYEIIGESSAKASTKGVKSPAKNSIKLSKQIYLIGGNSVNVEIKISDMKFSTKQNNKDKSFTAYATCDMDISVDAEFNFTDIDKDIDDELGDIGTIPIAGIGYFEFKPSFNIQGKTQLRNTYKIVAGFTDDAKGLHNISSFKKEKFTYVFEGSCKLGVKLGVGAKILTAKVGIYAEIGVTAKASATATTETSGRYTQCINLSAYLYFNIGVEFKIDLLFWKVTAKKEWKIFKEDNSPIRLNFHIENGEFVEKCTVGEAKYVSPSSTKYGSASNTGTYEGTQLEFYYSVSNGKVTITGCKGYPRKVVIPSKINGYPVTSIGERAFYNCIGLTSITIPNGVTSIGEYAFGGCTGLTSVTISNSVTSIGNGAFSGCKGLTSVTIGNSVTSIGNDAFNKCTSLTSITIPNSVTSIGNYAFYYCTGLTSVTIGNSVTSIGNDAFYYCTGLTNITIPDSVTSIGGAAFASCDSLTSVTIGNSVTSIGGSAFKDCTNLTSITIPDSVTSLGVWAFLGCKGLTSVTIGNSVTSIDERAFSGCTGLTSVTIPNGVTSIGKFAFEDCTGLTSITIPNGVTSIGDGAFGGCYGLISILVDSNNMYYDSRNNCNAIIKTSTNTLITGCKKTVIPNSVTSIGNYAFLDCTGLTSITIPNSVTSIGKSAFSGCTGLTSITIPNSVTSISNWAFGDCTSLTSITIPNSVTSIGDYAFNGCTSLTDVYYNGTKAQWNAITIGSHNSCLTEATIYCTDGVINPPHEHLYNSVVTPPTCTAKGYTTHTCSCGDKYVDTYVNALGHTEVADAAVAATCTTDGKTEGSHCSVCNEVFVPQETVKATGHKSDKGTVTKKATYTATGVKTYKCTVCGKVIKTETIAKLPKKANTLVAKGKTATVKFANLKKKNQTVLQKNAFAISKAQGKVTYKKASGNAKITVNAAGKFTIKKGLKKGTYKIKVKVTAAGNTTYKAVTKTVTVTIKVK